MTIESHNNILRRDGYNTVGFNIGNTTDPYVFVAEDESDPGSWWGGAFVHFEQWTPTISGRVRVMFPQYEDDARASNEVTERDYMIFDGDQLNVDYPDLTADSGSWPGTWLCDGWWIKNTNYFSYDQLKNMPDWLTVEAGKTYTIAFINWNSVPLAGQQISRTEFWQSVQQLGGVELLEPTQGGLLVLRDGVMVAGQDESLGASGKYAYAMPSAIATGDYSFAANTGIANGQYAIALGSECIAEADFSMAVGLNTKTIGGVAPHSQAMGNFAVARFESQHAHAVSRLNAVGDGQYVRQPIGPVATTDATQVTLFSDHSGIPVEINTTYAVEGKVLARRTDTVGTNSSWSLKCLVEVASNGTMRLVGSSSTMDFQDSGASTWAAIFAVDSKLRIKVTGQAGKTIHWVGVMKWLEMK